MRMIFLIALLATNLATTLAAQDVQMIEQAIRQRLGEMEKLKETQQEAIDSMAKGKISARLAKPMDYREIRGTVQYYFRTKEDREQAVQKARAKLELAASAVPPLIIRKDMRIGDFGTLPSLIGDPSAPTLVSYRIIQVVDDNNMLWEVTRFTPPQIQSAGDLVHRTPSHTSHQTIWVVDSTEGFVDGRGVSPTNVFQVTATRRFDTAIGGSKTVFVISPIDVNPVIERLMAERDVAEINPLRATEPKSELEREWTDKSGQFSLTATLVSFDGETAELKKTDGEILAVKSARLSESDRQYLKRWKEK